MIATTQIGGTFISDSIVEKMPMHNSMVYFKIESKSAERNVYFYFKKHKYKTRLMQEFMNYIAQN